MFHAQPSIGVLQCQTGNRNALARWRRVASARIDARGRPSSPGLAWATGRLLRGCPLTTSYFRV
jgi:hypothetical protein